jgi:hypothetical protein
MLRRAVSQELTDISEVLSASIVRAMMANCHSPADSFDL